MTEKEVTKLMNSRGYHGPIAVNKDGKGNLRSMTFIHLEEEGRLRVPQYSCEVFPKTEEFRCTYSVPHTINLLSTPKCGSLSRDEHFDHIVGKFESNAAVLRRFGS